MFDFFMKYGYGVEKYQIDSFHNRILLVLLTTLPSNNELRLCVFYLNPLNLFRFIYSSWMEATGSLPIKDYT